MEEQIVDIDTQNNGGELDAENTNNNLDENQDNDLEKKNKQLFERAKKAEAEAKELKVKLAETSKKGGDTPKNESFKKETVKNNLALKDVHEEDWDEIIEFSERKNIPIYEAVKSPYMKSFLKTRDEERKSAQAANTGGGRAGATAPTHDQVLKDFADGKVSEDDKDIAKLVEARFEARKAAAK